MSEVVELQALGPDVGNDDPLPGKLENAGTKLHVTKALIDQFFAQT